MTNRVTLLVVFLYGASIAGAKAPRLYKVRFREGAENCAIVRIPGSWQYSAERLPDELAPGQWELRKDATAPKPGYLLRWNGEDSHVPDNYSQNVFRFEWAGDSPAFFPVAPERWATASEPARTWRGNTGAHSSGDDSSKVAVEGKSFARTGAHWTGTVSDAILTSDKKWLVLQSSDGRIVRRTFFSEGPDRPLDGRIHIDVYHVPTGARKIQLEINQTAGQGLIAFLADTIIYESQYLFLRIDLRPQQIYYLICKLPIVP